MKWFKTKPDYEMNLTRLPGQAREALPVSISVSGVLSHYGDTVWDFTPYIHTSNTMLCHKKIDFSSLKFADGSCLIDPQHAGLLADAKAYIYVRMAHKNPMTDKPLSASSITSEMWGNLRSLLRWMTAEGHGRLVNLTPEVCLAYIAHCKNATTWEYSSGGHKGRKLSKKSLMSRFTVLENLWHFRDHLSDTLSEHPWPGESPCSLAGLSRGGRGNKGKTEMIPDRLMKQLVQGALRYVESGYGEKLLDCRDARNKGERIENHLAGLGLENWSDVTKEISRTITACYIVVDAFSGMRDSEMASLEVGCYHEHEGWDAAIYGWLKGTTYKLEEDPKPAEWMVPPVVGKAVKLAEQTIAPRRAKLEAQIEALEVKIMKTRYLNATLRKADIETLHNTKKHRRALFLGRSGKNHGVRTLTGSSINLRLRAFAEHLNLLVQASDLAQVRDKDRTEIGKVWPLAPHQFRRTFAVNVARSILGDVRYLREHYKHWSLDMTLFYAVAEYVHVDDLLFEEVLTERDELQATIIAGWIDMNEDQPMTGHGGKKIKSYRQRREVRTSKDSKDLARQISKGLYLRGLGHSWCTEKDCKGLGIYDVLECKECENRVIDKSHKKMWRGIRSQQVELLEMADLGDPMWHRAVSHLRYAEEILRDLGDEIEPYSVPPKPSQRRLCV